MPDKEFPIGDPNFYRPTPATPSGNGVTDGIDALAGKLGEVISSLIPIGSPVSLTNNTPANVTNISLTAGDWDVEGNVNLSETFATVNTRSAGINTTSATIPTDGTEVWCGDKTSNVTQKASLVIPRKRISISSTTTVYLVVNASFSGTVISYGSITARRVR